MDEVPKSIRVNTGDQYKVQRTIDDFFVRTRDRLVEMMGVDKKFFEVQVKGWVASPTTLDAGGAQMLLYKENVVAVVTETRTDFNYCQYDFFLNLDNAKH